jgi:Transferrin
LATPCVLQDCFVSIVEAKAEWAVADPMILYLLDAKFGGTPKAVQPFVRELRSSATRRSKGTDSHEGADYYAVAMLRTETCARARGGSLTFRDTRGMRSCHTRYGDLAGWAYPVYQLAVEKLSTGRDGIAIVRKWFSRSCAPSNGKADICSACKNTTQCDLQDEYAGDFGVIAGLRSKACDIGFLDNYAAESTLQSPGTGKGAPEFSILCDRGCQSPDQARKVRRCLSLQRPGSLVTGRVVLCGRRIEQ